MGTLVHSIGVPAWICLYIFLIGGYANQGLAIATTAIVIYLLLEHKKRLRNALIIYSFICYIIPTIYLWIHPPLLGERDFPLDELIVMFAGLGFIAIVFSYYNFKKEILIRSLKDSNAELLEKKLELERFTYIASHDLKTPLRSINSFTGLIRRGIKNQEYSELEEYLNYVKTASSQMNDLLNGILSFSKLNQNAVSGIELVDLNEPLKIVIENLSPDIQEKNGLLEYDVLPQYRCNPSDIVIIFQNLIQNGLKYNESEKPLIKIRCREKVDGIFIEITDNGIGILEEYQEQIFNLFKRLHAPGSYEGTGLGLGIVKKLVDKYGGNISVDSEIGVYSTFTVFLPRSTE